MAPVNLMLRYNSDTLKLEYSTNEGSSWSELDISGMTLVPAGDITKVDGVALGTHASGYVPDDARRVDGVALGTHGSGQYPADIRALNGSALNNLISGRMDVNVGEMQAGAKAGFIRQIIHGSISISASTGTSTADSSAFGTALVSTNNAIILHCGWYSTQSSVITGYAPQEIMYPTLHFSDTSHVRATFSNNGSKNGEVRFTVVEFYR